MATNITEFFRESLSPYLTKIKQIATQSSDGMMSSSDKTKLDDITVSIDNEASTVVSRDEQGSVFVAYLNSNIASENDTDASEYYFGTADGFIRKKDLSDVKNELIVGVEVKDKLLTVDGVSLTDTTYAVGDGGLTEINFTSTRRDKLDGIESNANNYTLPSNVVKTTGAVFEGLVAYDDTSISTTIDCSLGNSFSKNVTADFTLSFSNVPASGNACIVVLKLYDAGDYTITFPSEVKWADATAPTFTSDGVDTVVFYTIDGGDNWYANASVGYA